MNKLYLLAVFFDQLKPIPPPLAVVLYMLSNVMKWAVFLCPVKTRYSLVFYWL